MHLNKDNLYEQEIEFDYAVQVLSDNTKDYDIKKVKLVKHHLTHSIHTHTHTTIYTITMSHSTSFFHIRIPIFNKDHCVVYCVNQLVSHI
jgi:hypothetical protein